MEQIKANDLKINNLVYYNGEHKEIGKVSSIMAHIDGSETVGINQRVNMTYDISDLQPIPLDESILLSCPQFAKNLKSKISLIFNIELGRNRVLSLADIGTPNGFIWLCERDEENINKMSDAVCLYNYDHDGKLYLHQLQNILSIFNIDLEINLKELTDKK